MNIYYTTLLEAVIDLCALHRSDGVLVMEDTCLLRPDVGYKEVAREVQNRRAGVFGYGNRWWQNGREEWHGTKGVYMTPDWCAEIWIILSNTHVEQYRHVDMWLKKMLRLGQARGSNC